MRNKNLIIAYCFPRPLGDYELPKRVKAYRNSINNETGSLTPDDMETLLIIEAGQTEQYGRFIKHLMHSFCDDPKKVSSINGDKEDTCCICGKITHQYTKWKKICDENPELEEKNKREWLTYGSTESNATLCLDCITQLVNAKKMMDVLDPGFFDWTKRKK